MCTSNHGFSKSLEQFFYLTVFWKFLWRFISALTFEFRWLNKRAPILASWLHENLVLLGRLKRLPLKIALGLQFGISVPWLEAWAKIQLLGVVFQISISSKLRRPWKNYKRKRCCRIARQTINYGEHFQKKTQKLSRRKETLIKKSHELGTFCDVDVALFLRIRKTGRLIVYKSIDLESWPPSKEHIVSTSSIGLNCANKTSATYIPSSSDLASTRRWSQVWKAFGHRAKSIRNQLRLDILCSKIDVAVSSHRLYEIANQDVDI